MKFPGSSVSLFARGIVLQRHGQCLLTAIQLMLLPLATLGQPSVSTAGAAETDAQRQHRFNFTDRMAQASSAARAGNSFQAEQTLLHLIRARPGTAGWEFECAQRLVHLANDLTHNAEVDAAKPLVVSGMAHLRAAINLSDKRTLKANAYALLAGLEERYVGDVRAAIASMRLATSLDPSFLHAKNELERLERVQAGRGMGGGQ